MHTNHTYDIGDMSSCGRRCGNLITNPGVTCDAKRLWNWGPLFRAVMAVSCISVYIFGHGRSLRICHNDAEAADYAAAAAALLVPQFLIRHLPSVCGRLTIIVPAFQFGWMCVSVSVDQTNIACVDWPMLLLLVAVERQSSEQLE